MTSHAQTPSTSTSTSTSTSVIAQNDATAFDDKSPPAAPWTPPLWRRAPWPYTPLIKATSQDSKALHAMPNPGLFDLVAQELRRHLPRLEDAMAQDPRLADAAIASLWNVLAHDAEVAAEATPAAASKSAIDRIEAEFGKALATRADALVREAGETLVAGLRELDPLKLRDAYLKTAEAFEITRGARKERLAFEDVASGWFAEASDLDLRGRPELRTSLVVQRDGLAFVVAMSDAMRMLALAATPDDGARVAMAQVMAQVVRATVLKEPFLIDADAVTFMARSADPADQHRLHALRATFLMQQRLARRGLSMAPRFVSLLKRESGEWRELSGGSLLVSDADLLDELCAPMSPPLPLRDVDQTIDTAAPLKGLTRGKRRLVQTLDCEQGRIDIALALDSERASAIDERPFRAAVHVDPLPAGATPQQRLHQDRQIRQIDDFIRAHFLRVVDKPENGLPPEIRLKGQEIFVGKLRVATEKEGRWVGDADAIKRAVGTLWVHDRIPGSFPGTQARLALAPPRFMKGGKRLTLVLQMEKDDEIDYNARLLTRKEAGETAWVQLNRDGGFRIADGEEWIRGLASDGLIKLVVVGHGTRLGNLDEAALADYSAGALAARVRKALGELRLPRRVDRVTLFSCTQESPVFPRSFATEFLLAADKAGFLRPAATLTAYAENVAFSPFGSRHTQPHGDAPSGVHRPEATFSFHIDAGTKQVVRRDKHPQGFEDGIIATPRRTDVRRPVVFSDDVDEADAIRLPGHAGTLFEVLATLKRTLKQVPDGQVAPLGETPDAITAAVRDAVQACGGTAPEGSVSGRATATKMIADGLWQADPDLLYDGFAALSKAFGEYAPQRSVWELDDLPIGAFDKVRMPSAELSRHPTRLELPIGELAFLAGVQGGSRALIDLSGRTFNDAFRRHLSEQTLALLRSALSGRPFAVDKDRLEVLSASSNDVHRAQLRSLEVVHGATMALARNGVVEAPIYLTGISQDAGTGWERQQDGSAIHRGDLLPDLLPERKAEIDRMRSPPPADIDDANPLSRLAAFMPLARQTIDRTAGTITIEWPLAKSGRQAATTLQFKRADAGGEADIRARQDIDIRTLDTFIVGAFMPYDALPVNAAPALIRIDGDQLMAGRAVVAERKAGVWTTRREKLLEVQHALNPTLSPGPFPSVDEWAFHADGYVPRSHGDGVNSRLLLILQMEPGEDGQGYAVQSIIDHPDDAVWIQVDPHGEHRVRSGGHLLERATDKTPIKLEVVGHGRNDLRTRAQTLAGYSSTELADRLASLQQDLRLRAKVERVALISCRLETPGVLHSFGADFLKEADRKGLTADSATIVSYGEVLLTPGLEDDLLSRSTQQFPGAPVLEHQPGVTWISRKDPLTGAIIQSDKYPATTLRSSVARGGPIERTHDHVHADGSRGDRQLARDRFRQWGSAGSLRELFRTLDKVLERSGMGVLDGAVPTALTQAIEASLKQTLSTDADPGLDFSTTAKQIAKGLWRRDPMALYDGFADLNDDCDTDATIPVDWDGRPRGWVKDVRFPSRMLDAFRKGVLLPAAEAGFMSALDAGWAALKQMAMRAGSAPDDTARIALAQQTGDLVHALLAGRPFVVDVDQLAALSPSGLKRPAGTTALDVLEVVHGAAMHLTRQGIMAEPIYLSDATTASTPGWEKHADGSRVHRGDLLPELLPDRGGSLAWLRQPFSRPVDDAAPLARLRDFMPKAKQSLDRAKGTITITWRGEPPRRQADSVLHFRPLPEGAGAEGRRGQDADIQALDEFIVSAFFDVVGARQNATPSQLKLVDGVLTASNAVLAKRVNDRWYRDTGAIRQTQAVLGAYAEPLPATAVSTWRAGLGDALNGMDGAGELIGKKLRLHVQIEDDKTMLRGARRVVRNHPDEVVWIQMDRLGDHRIVYGAQLLEQVRPDLPVKITIEGHGSHDEFKRSQVFADFTPDELADSLATLVAGLKLGSRARQAMLLGCGLVAPMVASDYAEQFLEAAISKGVLHEDVELTAYAATVTMVDDLDAVRSPSKKTRRFRGEQSRRFVPGTTWLYRKHSGTGQILRTDKHPAAEFDDAYGIDSVHTIDRDEARNVQPGRAGPLSELFGTLGATQVAGGIAKRDGNAPDAVVEAVQGKLRFLLSKVQGVSEHVLQDAARSLADGLWRRDPATLHEGYVKLSAVCAADSGQAAKVVWGDQPIGVVDRAITPSQLRLKFTKFMEMPLADAALVHGLQAAVAGMRGLAPDAQADAQADAIGRAFAQQTLALTEALLSGQPFTVDADAVFRMSTMQDVKARATLDVLDVTHATAMQLARRAVMATPIFLTDARQSPDVGWEGFPDGSRVHRGDILPNVLPERGTTIERLRTPAATAVDDARPLPRLARFMPEARQTLDRRAGTVTIVWPGMKDGRQADSVLRFAPLDADADADADAGLEARRRQDADMLAMDDFILREFFPAAGPMRNSMPGELRLTDGRLVAGRSVLADRQGEGWVRHDAAMREALSILSPLPVESQVERPATSWHGDIGDAITGLKVADTGTRLVVHLQMEEDLVMVHGARRTVRNHPEDTVWIQVDRLGHQVIRYGEALLKNAAPDLPVKIEISGHGSHDPATRTQRLAGYGAVELAARVGVVMDHIGLRSRAKHLTLVACAIEAPVVADSFGAAFMKAALDQRIVRQDATLVAYGEVLIRNNRLEGTQPSRTTRRHPGAAPEKHAPGVTWQFRKDETTGEIVRTDKYPAGKAEDANVVGDDDSALTRLADFRDEAYGALASASTVDGLAGRTLPLQGIDVPLTFLASLGATIDDRPLTGDLLHDIANLPDDPATRLKIEPELFRHWTSLLSDQPDAEISDRLRALGGWLDQREKQSGVGAAFIGEASPETRAIADRLTSAWQAEAEAEADAEVGGDGLGDGQAWRDAALLRAARGDPTRPTSLLGDILADLSPSTRADFEGWLKSTGQSLDDLQGMAPSRPGREGDTPVEKVVKAIERRVQGDDGIDFDKMLRVNKDNALAGLREIGVVQVGEHGLRLDATRLKRYIDSGDGVKLAYAARAFRKMSGKAYGALLDAAPDSVRPFMTEMRRLPSSGKTLGKKVLAGFNKVDGAIDYIDTAQGVYQILAHWDVMSPTQKGLSVVQSGGIVISRLAMMAGQALSKLAPVARSGVLRLAGAGLAGGAANVGLSALGIASCALEWQALKDSGQGIDSHAGKSAIANTVMACTSFIVATASAVVGAAVFLAGGATAVAGTALGLASSVLGAVGAPLAIVMFITSAVVQAALWFEEFGQYIRDGTSVDDKAAAGFAKAFGFSTDVTLRAETEKAAREAAARLSQSLKAQQQSDLEFEARQLGKQGYDTARIPDTTHPVKHATFYDGQSSQRYNFALQPGKVKATTFKRVTLPQRGSVGLRSGTAWLSMDLWEHETATQYVMGGADRQLLQVGSLNDVSLQTQSEETIFQARRPSNALLEGSGSGVTEIQIDAEGSDVALSFLTIFGSPGILFEYPGRLPNRVLGAQRATVRNAAKATVSGSGAGEHFDVSASEATIRGGGGNDTYIVRAGNRIFSASRDVAIWTRGVSGAAIDVGHAAASLLLKVDVLHESLSFRRDGEHLDVVIGQESLRLERYFGGADQPGTATAAAVVIVDAVGTILTLIEPEVIKEETISVTALDKHLAFSKELPVSRRTLSGDHARTRFHLSSGGGDVRVEPMTAMPMNLFLDVPVDRLGLHEEGDDLDIIETPPVGAPETFVPLRLRLSGLRRSDADESDADESDRHVTVWVADKDKDKPPAVLVLPKAGEPVDATARVLVSLKDSTGEKSDVTMTSTTEGNPSVAGQGTKDADVIDARSLPDGTVLRGGLGADTYRIKAGQSHVIDNRAEDSARDVLEVDDIGWLALLKDLRFSRSGGDLVIGMAGGQITVRDHAARSHARRLTLGVGDKRFALPVIQDGFMVHLSSPAEGDVPATAPGVHMVLPRPGRPWDLRAQPKRVWMRRPDEVLKHGSSVEAVRRGDLASRVILVDYQHAPEAWALKEDVAQDEGRLAGVFGMAIHDHAFPIGKLHEDLLAGTTDPGHVYPLETVRGYLVARGVPREVADQIRSDTFQRLQRLHQLLAVAVDSRDRQLPAAFIDLYTASDLTPSADQGPMLRFLASRRSPWAYDELILRHALSMTQLQVFESWADVHVGGVRGSDNACAALAAFSQMLNGNKPSGSFAPSLLAKVLELKGRPRAIAQQLALAMQAADTLDDHWVAGMLQAGAVHHDVLRRLRDAGVSPQDLVLSNANRLRYEGSGDRSALIAVNASESLKSPLTNAYRYTLKYYLKLDKAGGRFERRDRSRQAGVVYDFVPGIIVDENGESPDPVSAYATWHKTYAEKIAKEEKKLRGHKSHGTVGGAATNASPWYDSQIPEYKEALSSVVRLKREGLANVETYQAGGTWDGRSTPGNLVDGFDGHDETVAWRPGASSASSGDDNSKPDISVDPDKFIQFDFAHPVALTGLTLKIDASSLEWTAEALSSPSSIWQILAQRKDQAWVEVSSSMAIQARDKHPWWHIDTKGVPYSRYRLTGMHGTFPKAAWFSEVTFSTGEAGMDSESRSAVSALQVAGYGDEEIRSLFLMGLRDQWDALKVAVLRRHFGPLPLAVALEDAQRHHALTDTEIAILKDLRAESDDSQPWSAASLLKAVRLRAAHRHLQLLNERLPFLDPESIQDEAHRQFVAQMKEGLVDKRDASVKQDRENEAMGPGTVPEPSMPDWLKDVVILSPVRTSDLPRASKSALNAGPHEAARRLVDEQYARLAAGLGEAGAMRATAPWYLHLFALTAAASGRDLRLRVTSDTTEKAQAVRAVIEDALPRLQAAQDEGLLKVSIAASMPPVGDVKAWSSSTPTSTSDGAPLHLSPGTALVTEYGQARDGLPIPRLKAGGFTDDEALSLFGRGVQTVEQVTRAIEWRKLFPTLPWKIVADGALYVPASEGVPREPVSGQGGQGSPVRGGLTQVQLAEFIDGQLPIDAPRLFNRAMTGRHLLTVRHWLDAMGNATANLPIAAQLTRAASGAPGALASAIGLAVKQKLLHHGASTVTETSGWAPSALRGFISLEPGEGGKRTASFDASIFNVLSVYERLLDTLGDGLKDLGHDQETAAEALRSNYVELAVIRAAIAGQQLRLQVPAGASPREQAFMTLIGARLAALQQMDARDLLDVRIVSAMPPVDPADGWTTEAVDGKTWHQSPDASPEAWLRAKASQAIPRLEADGFSGEEARALYALGVTASDRVARAIELRKQFRSLPPEVVAKEVMLPPLAVEQRRYAIDLVRHLELEPAEVLAAFRGNKLKPLREVVVNEDHLPHSWRDLLWHTYGEWFPLVKGSPVSALLSRLTTSLGESLAPLKLEAKESVDDLAWALLQAVSGPVWHFRRSLSEVIQTVQWWHARRDLQADVVLSAPWAPKCLQALVSLGDGREGGSDGEAGHALAAPTAIVLRAFEGLLETLEAALRQRGDSEASVAEAMAPHVLRLAALHASASGRQLRLHVPPTGSPADRELRDLLDLAIPFLEKARSAGLVDVAIASAIPPVDPAHAWATEVLEGTALHVSSTGPLESALNEALRSYPFHRLTAAGYGDDDAWALQQGGVDTGELVDRAIQLRGFFGDLSPQLVLAELGNAPFTALEERLAAKVGWLARRYSLDATALVRGGAVDPVIRIASELIQMPGGLFSSEDIQQSQRTSILQWLSDTQGSDWVSDDAHVTAFVEVMGLAAAGDIGRLTEALSLARRLGFTYRGQTTVVDRDDWMPETVSRHGTLVLVEDGEGQEGGEGASAMAASDYVVLQGFKRLLDLSRSGYASRGKDEASATSDIGPFYLQLQVLRAAAAGRTLELVLSGSDSREGLHLRTGLKMLLSSLTKAQQEGLVKVRQRPSTALPSLHGKLVVSLPDVQTQGEASRRSKRAAADPGPDQGRGGEPQRQANLLLQEMSGERPASVGGTSFPASQKLPSPMSLLSAQSS